MIDQMRGGLRHAAGVARRAQPAALAREGDKEVMRAASENNWGSGPEQSRAPGCRIRGCGETPVTQMPALAGRSDRLLAPAPPPSCLHVPP